MLSNLAALYFTGGPLGPRERALCWARCFFGPCAVRAPRSTEHVPSVTSRRFSLCRLLNCPGTTTTPHLDSALPCDVTHHMEEPLKTVGCAAARAITSSCISLSFHTLLFFQSTRHACRGITHHFTISLSLRLLRSLCACCADNHKLGGSPARVRAAGWCEEAPHQTAVILRTRSVHD